MKVKIDQYKVYSKKRRREQEILVFRKEKYMWAFDDYPEMDMMMVDGDKNAFKALKLAYAILTQEPNKIIYFPVRDIEGIGEYYGDTWNLVLMRPELQFRRSEWFEIKKKLDKRHLSEKYILNYNRHRLDNLWKRQEKEFEQYGGDKRSQQIYHEEVLGDTLFMVVPRECCCRNHYCLAETLDNYKNGRGNSDLCYPIGWLISDRGISEMKESRY